MSSGGVFDLDTKEKRLQEINQISSRPDFWNDSDKAQTLLKEQAGLKETLEGWQRNRTHLDEAHIYLELAAVEESEEALEEAAAKVALVASELPEIELSQILGGADDPRNAIVSLHPGAGGTEAQDWAEMLLRMYLRWADRRGFKTEILE
ncbi:MAG: PCRF domain-containing protein, partial [Deltaproteobacteria bacterium]|nr:PCRF domain-containing protein [Deltaproteobacteria bacterium]